MKIEGMIIKVDGKLYVSLYDTDRSCSICDLNADCGDGFEDICAEIGEYFHFEELKDD